jgi:hypothetical protein
MYEELTVGFYVFLVASSPYLLILFVMLGLGIENLFRYVFWGVSFLEGTFDLVSSTHAIVIVLFTSRDENLLI